MTGGKRGESMASCFNLFLIMISADAHPQDSGESTPQIKEGILSFGGGDLRKFPSYAVAARDALQNQFTDRRHFFTARKPQDYGARTDVYPQGLTFRLSDQNNNRTAIHNLGVWLHGRGTSRLHSVLYAPAGAGGMDTTFLKLRNGELTTHTPDGQVTPEYQAFLDAVQYTTGTAAQMIVEELSQIEAVTGGKLFDADSQLAMVGYNPRGYLPDGTEDPVGDPYLTRLYAPIDHGKLAAKGTAQQLKEQGFHGVTVYDTVEILTRSSDTFPTFETIVLERLFTRMYHHPDARKNPFWQEFFEYLEKHFPDFQKLGQMCHDVLYGSELLDIWKGDDLNFGEKCNAVVRAVHSAFGGKLAEIRQIAYAFSYRADSAFGTRLAQALACKEFAGQPTAYLGYDALANTDLPPAASDVRRYSLPPTLHVGTPEYLQYTMQHRVDRNYGVTYPLPDGSSLVPLGSFMDTEHMAGIVPGVILTTKALNEHGQDWQPGVRYSASFAEPIRAGQQMRTQPIRRADHEFAYSNTQKKVRYAQNDKLPEFSGKEVDVVDVISVEVRKGDKPDQDTIVIHCSPGLQQLLSAHADASGKVAIGNDTTGNSVAAEISFGRSAHTSETTFTSGDHLVDLQAMSFVPNGAPQRYEQDFLISHDGGLDPLKKALGIEAVAAIAAQLHSLQHRVIVAPLQTDKPIETISTPVTKGGKVAGEALAFAELQAQGRTTRIDEAGMYDWIPHRGSFFMARGVETTLVNETSKLKSYLSTGSLHIDRPGGPELLVEAFAQASVAAPLIRYNLTLFRGFEVEFTEHAFHPDGSPMDFQGRELRSKTYTEISPSTGKAVSTGIVEDESGRILAHIKAEAFGQ